MALCNTHHVWDADLSPHQNPAAFVSWLECEHPAIAEWMFDNCRPTFEGTTNVSYYCDVIRSLKEYVEPEDYERIVGIRFSRWLEENE